MWLAAILAVIVLAAPRAAAQPPLAPAAVGTAPDVRAPYLTRGDEVEARYQAYRDRLQRFFEALRERLELQAPALLSAIAPPAPVPHGYQILPGLLPESPWRPSRRRIVVSTFSWSRTDALVDRERARLEALGPRLATADSSSGAERVRVYEELVDGYKKLVAGQKLIESTIQYNRLWQGEIVRYPDIYRNLTALNEVALTRQAYLDALPLGEQGIEADLVARVAVLSRRIEEAIRKLPTPEFVRVDHPSPRRWVLRVPVYTDIGDSAFIERFRAAIEHAWLVRDGQDEFSVALDIQLVSPASLYPDGRMPAHGAHIDLGDHMRRFPPGGVVLTTGATLTHASGRSILLGPHAIEPGTLVHEFGHMLGFKDGYFRGYRDGGPDGYEVIEVILDPDEVLSVPEQGRVRRQHFDQILGERRG